MTLQIGIRLSITYYYFLSIIQLFVYPGHTKIGKLILDVIKCYQEDCLSSCRAADTINDVSFVVKNCSFNNEETKCSDPAKPGTIAHIKCSDHYYRQGGEQTISCDKNKKWNPSPELCTPICGELTSEELPNSVGGFSTRITNVPWHVGLYKSDGTSYTLQCGGTIVNARIVLSAMHCFWSQAEREPYDASMFRVAAGKEKLLYDSYEEHEEQQFEVERIHYDREYKGSSEHFLADIVIVVLKTSIEFKSHIKPICLPFGKRWFNELTNYPTAKGRVSGWGLTRSGGGLSQQLRTVELPVISHDRCLTESDASFRPSITEDKFCAGYLNSNTAVCQGDSGGGLVFPSEHNKQVSWYIRGIVSTGARKLGTDSCDSDKYSTFTDILYYEALITKNEEYYRPREIKYYRELEYTVPDINLNVLGSLVG